jgi:membrane protease YdiL (CAAX protease family)
MNLPRAQRPAGGADVSGPGGRLTSIFWNERRLRSGWRLLGLVLLVAAGVEAAVLLRPGVLRAFPGGLAAHSSLTAPGGLLSFALLVFALGLPSLCAVRLFDQRPLESLGWHRYQGVRRTLLFGAFVGAAAALAVHALPPLLGLVMPARVETAPASVMWSLEAGLLLAVAIALRETVLRGCLLPVLVEGIGAESAVMLSALLGAAALLAWHLLILGQFPPWPAVLCGVVEGLLLGYAMRRTRSLWLPWALTLGWYGTLGVVLGYPILGVRLVQAPAPAPTGEALLTGGALGPMGALPAVLGQLLALVAILLFGPTPDAWTAELWDRHVRGSRSRAGGGR